MNDDLSGAAPSSTIGEEVSRDAARIHAELTRLAGGTDPFAAAVRATRMPMIITDPRLADNPVVFANEAFCRLSGYERQEILGRNCRFLQGEETDPATVAKIRAAVSTAQSIEIDIRNYRKDGEPFWNRLLMAPVLDASGTLAYFFASQVDVTLERERLKTLESRNAALSAELAGRLREQREGEFRLALSEASLRLATDAAEVGTWDLDLQTDILTWSDRTKAMFGISPGVPCSMVDFYAGLHPDDRAATGAAFAAAVDPALRAPYDVEYRTVGKEDGLVRWIAAKGRGLFVDGRCTRALGTAIDITARKRAGGRQTFLIGLWDRVRELTEPRAIMDATVEALGRFLGANRVGYGQVRSDDETVVLETNYADGVAPLAGIFHLASFGAANVARQRQGLTLVCSDLAADPLIDGAAWPQSRSLIAVPLVRDGRLRAWMFVTHRDAGAWAGEDVTLVEDVAARTWDAVERARAEAALREGNEMLEQRIAAALAEQEKVEEALRQAQKMESVGQLTGGIAHDFNNLLTGIMGSLELLQMRIAAGRTEGLERYTGAALTAGQRAAALTQRLLAFARRQPLDPKRVEANRLLVDMEDLLRRTLGPGIDLEMVLAGGLWPTLCDPNQLESAILNLAINARDAMPDGGRLTIETANALLDEAYARGQGGEVAAGQYIALAVTDTGTGMPPDVIAKAFDPFFTTKPTGQGTGLGLSMLYGFVKQSEGHVRIYSELGRGTSFKLYLPRFRGATGDQAGGETGEAPPALEAEVGETVLVVDDEATVRMLVTETLQELGYAAIEAADGPSGLRILQSDARIDLLVTDVGLPGLNGRQLADAARVTRPHLGILFMTGYAHNAAIGQGDVLERGMQIISKPFTLDVLARKIRSMIEEV